MLQLPVRPRHPAGGDTALNGMRRGLWRLALLGLVALGGSVLLFQTSATGFSLAMLVAGFGWGTATIGAMAMLHRDARPSPLWLALHDASLFVAALLGALTLGRLG